MRERYIKRILATLGHLFTRKSLETMETGQLSRLVGYAGEIDQLNNELRGHDVRYDGFTELLSGERLHYFTPYKGPAYKFTFTTWAVEKDTIKMALFKQIDKVKEGEKGLLAGEGTTGHVAKEVSN